ncbi:hypothetical protein N657DRAFT_465113 [Parathielavia appendiculata]|uniref:Uncharacterized protein n=1 Tax=Parathielavia appendiculata TaxID=2587402 RepID=A0AAN6TPX9_9PEZI|nr:hypothetical protein N657DRAFT_465113 [Parathielavia appendiculata]
MLLRNRSANLERGERTRVSDSVCAISSEDHPPGTTPAGLLDGPTEQDLLASARPSGKKKEKRLSQDNAPSVAGLLFEPVDLLTPFEKKHLPPACVRREEKKTLRLSGNRWFLWSPPPVGLQANLPVLAGLRPWPLTNRLRPARLLPTPLLRIGITLVPPSNVGLGDWGTGGTYTNYRVECSLLVASLTQGPLPGQPTTSVGSCRLVN